MEDAHLAVIDKHSGSQICIFGVFDGHGGSEVAKFVKLNFMKTLREDKNYQNGNFQKALEETFLNMDRRLLTPEGRKELTDIRREEGMEGSESMAGCTANVSLIHNGTIWCANSGDSRSIVYNATSNFPLSKDHKPDDPRESDRIQKAGGFIVEGRVNGNLNLSRALGDLEYKREKSLKEEEQMITAFPDVTTYKIKSDDLFIVMGCDGIWETMNEDQIGDFFRKNLNESTPISTTVGQFLDASLATDTTSTLLF